MNDLGQLNLYHVDAALLHQQEAYFVYTGYCFGVASTKLEPYCAWENLGVVWPGMPLSDPTPATQTLDYKADAMFGVVTNDVMTTIFSAKIDELVEERQSRSTRSATLQHRG